MKRILLSLASIGSVAAIAIVATGAFFTDTETSVGNTFQAGAIDLKIDSTAHYNGMVCAYDNLEDAYFWEDEDNDQSNNATPEMIGEACFGSWSETDLTQDNVFFEYMDLKPGDYGENTISMHVYDNDAWLRFMVYNTQNLENSHLENEIEAGDNTPNEGELQEALAFSVFIDQGDIAGFQNIGPDGEPVDGPVPDETEGDNLLNGQFDQVVATPGPINPEGEAYDLWPILTEAYTQSGCTVASGDTDYGICHGLAEDGRAVASTTYYFGIDWELPADTGNQVQSDGFFADIRFEAEQWRNNPSPASAALPTPAPTVGAVLGGYTAVAPESGSCSILVETTESIQTAINSEASVGDTVCVADSYDATGDNAAIRISKDNVKVMSLTQGTALDVPVVLDNPGTQVSGFTGFIGQAESPAEVAAFYIDGDADNVVISYNTVSGSGIGAAVLTESGGTNGGSLIANNILSGAVQGIYLNPHTGLITIENNDIDDNVAGIANLTGALVQYNEFEHTTPGSEAIGAGNGVNGDYDGSLVQFNNFLDDTMINAYTLTTNVDAPNNYFSPNGAAVQASVDVDYTPEAVVAFAHN